MQLPIKSKHYDVFIFSNVFGIPFFLIGSLIMFKLPEVFYYGLFFVCLGAFLVGFRVYNELDKEGLLHSKKIYSITFSSKRYLYSEFENIKVDVISNIGRKGLNRHTRKTIDLNMTYKKKAYSTSGVELTSFFKIQNLSVSNENIQLWNEKINDFSKVSGLPVVYTEMYHAEINALV